ncbi:universal stress protein [Candidatus Sumerlaeota bacterium]|nr:universal stress protein [Candidatus Sumerlaeota bacterium]
MIELKKILYPTDFSEHAGHAKKYVIELARQFSAKVVAMHVITLPISTYPDEAMTTSFMLLKESRKTAGDRLEALVQELQQEHGLEAESLFKEGTPFVEICIAAREINADLIIIATHGSGFIKHLLIGSTAEKVVRKAPCPVLTIRHPEHEFVLP